VGARNDAEEQRTSAGTVDESAAKHAALAAVGLLPLMDLTEGRRSVQIALVDGPVALDHPDIASEAFEQLGSGGACTARSSAACEHGTFIAGIVGARRPSNAPAICPGCTFLLRPIFTEARGTSMPGASAEDLAAGIVDAVRAGANVINMSVGVMHASSAACAELSRAIDEAMRHGVLLVAAAGNQGTVGSSVLTRHPWVISVAAYTSAGRILGASNLGRSIGAHGLGAPGDQIISLASGGGTIISGGTSAAAAFVTGAIGLLWSALPSVAPHALRAALRPESGRRIAPPMLDAGSIYQRCLARKEHLSMDTHDVAASTPAPTQPENRQSPSDLGSAAVLPQQACAKCAGEHAAADAAAAPPVRIYALGRIEPRFPRVSVEKEFAQALAGTEAAGLTDKQALQKALALPQHRYLARQACWVFSVDGIPTYLLYPRDPADYSLLIDALRAAPRPTDIDLVVGVRGPVAGPEVCNGLQVPIVVFEQLYSFDLDGIVKAIPRPKETKEGTFSASAEELFQRIMLMTDNAGSTDEHRALNYLAVRHDRIYALVAEQHEKNAALTGVDVRPSRLSGTRNLQDVIFSFTHRQTDVVEKYAVRVDVTDLFPFLVTKLGPHYDRG
jgi:hypothetical protein